MVHDRVDGDDDVVGRDDLLRRYFDDLLAHVDLQHAVDERDDQPHPGVDGRLVPAEPLDDASLVGAHDLDAARGHEEQQRGQ